MKHIKTFESFLNEANLNTPVAKQLIEVVVKNLVGMLEDENYTEEEVKSWFSEHGVHEIDSIIEGLSDDERFMDLDITGKDLIKVVQPLVIKKGNWEEE